MTSANLLQTLILYLGFSQQMFPVIRRMAAFEHFAEYPIGVVTTLVCPQISPIVDLRIHDDLGSSVVAKE